MRSQLAAVSCSDRSFSSLSSLASAFCFYSDVEQRQVFPSSLLHRIAPGSFCARSTGGTRKSAGRAATRGRGAHLSQPPAAARTNSNRVATRHSQRSPHHKHTKTTAKRLKSAGGKCDAPRAGRGTRLPSASARGPYDDRAQACENEKRSCGSTHIRLTTTPPSLTILLAFRTRQRSRAARPSGSLLARPSPSARCVAARCRSPPFFVRPQRVTRCRTRYDRQAWGFVLHAILS